jgi:hypothetical protein
MRHLGKISGRGELLSSGASLGEAAYEIDVWEDRQVKLANGRLQSDGATLMQAFGADTKLILRTGEKIDIVVTRHFAPGGSAEIKVSGPVPGF